MANKISLTFAVSEMPHTSAVRDGTIPIDGVDGTFLTIKPQIGAFRRMVRDVEFGVDNSKITWVVDDEEHVTQLRLPENVIHAPEGRSLPYGIEANIKTIEALEQTAFRQGLTPRRMTIDELFVDPAKVFA